MSNNEHDIITVIPAQPGYYILDLISEAEGVAPREFWRASVIAWRVHSSRVPGFGFTDTAHPVSDEHIKELAILRPDGTVFDGCEQFENEEAALHAYAAQWRARGEVPGAPDTDNT